MAQWRVIADRIKLFPHSNSDRLEVGKVGKFQIVVSKETGYKDGDLVVFAPERSILPAEIRGEYVNTDTGYSYLQGDNHDRVGAVRLRGELSEGVTLPLHWVCCNLQLFAPSSIPIGQDLSAALGITKYIPPIPAELIGKVSHMNESDFDEHFVRHDVENYITFSDEFVPGELVQVTEKVHGSQMNVMRSNGLLTLTSKYLGYDGMLIDCDPNNNYWRAVFNSFLDLALMDASFEGHSVQVVAELLPCQKGFNYGFTEPNLRIFRLVIDGVSVRHNELAPSVRQWFGEHWVPFLGVVPFNLESFKELAAGREQVSGKELHIKEGIVVTPALPRLNSEGHLLNFKWLNPKFKGAPTDFA